jgi:ATP synthase subunit 6
MNYNPLFIKSPLEQFLIIPIIKVPFLNFVVTNQLVFLLLSLALIFSVESLFNSFFFKGESKNTFSIRSIDLPYVSKSLNYFFVKRAPSTLLVIPNYAQILFELIIKNIFSMLNENVKSKEAEQFFPFVFTLFLILVNLNLIGLIPYTFTITGHLVITFVLSSILFIGINIICINTYGEKMFSLFLPNGTSIELSFLLVPIELISYIFKPISLSIRLFANMMAGHTLLKVIAGFGWTLIKSSSVLLACVQVVPLVILIPLFVLEMGVAMIQAFVFTVLFCIYLNDALNLH